MAPDETEMGAPRVNTAPGMTTQTRLSKANYQSTNARTGFRGCTEVHGRDYLEIIGTLSC